MTGNQNAHDKAQKMYYLLGLAGVNVGGHGFVWDQYGPCSDVIQAVAHALDKKTTEVTNFYAAYPEGRDTDDVIYTDVSSRESLFEERERGRVEKIRQQLKIGADTNDVDANGDSPMRRWVELLGSLAYISQTMLPGSEKDKLIVRLQLLKEKYNVSDENSRALKVLKNANMLAIF